MQVNLDRIKKRILALHKIGQDENGGNTRLAFTAEDRRARNAFIKWMEDSGMEITIDPIGNIIGRYPGSNPTLPAIAIGSHLDTVPSGGMFDGILGCVSGLECVAALAEAGQRLNHPIEVIVFADEEGSRFGTILLGSRAMIGTLETEELKQATDSEGVTVWDAMQAFGLRPTELEAAKRREDEVAAYLEMHVEQGAVLLAQKAQAGVVTGIVGIKRFDIWIEGEANHAGTTPFSLRKDAMLSAAKVVMAVREETQRLGKPETVATVGQIKAWPGAVNVVAGKVRCSFEIRDVDELLIEKIEKAVKQRCQQIALEDKLSIEIQYITYVPPVPLHQVVLEQIVAASKELDVPYWKMPSGAGHDAQSMAKVYPTGMLFVPSQGGISHSPQEHTKWEDIAAGSKVLFDALLRLDESL